MTDVESAFYLHVEVADRPGVLAQVAEILGLQGVSIKSVVQKGIGEDARLVDGHAPGAGVEVPRGGGADRRGSTSCARAPRVIRVIEEVFE